VSMGDKTMAAAASEVYEPLNQYKPVARNIGIVDGPFEYLTTAVIRLPLPFTTRMTVVRRGSGDLFIHSPIAFEPALADLLQGHSPLPRIAEPVPLRAHWRVVTGVSGCDYLGLSARTQTCPLAGHRCTFR
jgi:hypothetical protein